ncbi:MAG TPA: ABC transporter permease [Opitutaceae bacterium]|nr:ABC transporter permease [Opitutaceae bacterium]
MPALAAPTAQANTRLDGDALVAELSGHWSVTERYPTWPQILASRKPKRVTFVLGSIESWDSALLLTLAEGARWSRKNQAAFELKDAPDGVQRLLDQLLVAKVQEAPIEDRSGFVYTLGVRAVSYSHAAREVVDFIGEVILSLLFFIRMPRKFRWRDCLSEMQQCGALALPIVGLINFLAGVTLAYTAAVILRQFGGDIYVADLVGLSMVREMASVMTATVLAGRTGAAFAAQLANMKANEEVDALNTLGMSPVDFLVTPRLVALALMMPLLAMYANMLGIIGGAVVARGVLEIPPSAYFIEMLTTVTLSDVAAGLIKASTFGVIVGLCGCLRGFQADRSAAGVGQAATSAVVTAILLIVIADSIYAVVFNIVGL